ncbi:MAG: hypothetical protein ACI9Y1_003229 [Lentisphaeria bacterium]|jgi:hypothetical protein
MKRYYYISDNLTELKSFEGELEAKGVERVHIHVLSDNQAAVDSLHINSVGSFWGARHCALWCNWFVDWSTGRGDNFVVVCLCRKQRSGGQFASRHFGIYFFRLLCVGRWLVGHSKAQQELLRFENLLHAGKHILMVDVHAQQEEVVRTKGTAYKTV